MMNKDKIEIDSVLLSYDNKRILSDIYLKCQIGEIVGIIGRNGSGKSSLLKILFGSLNSDNKSVRLNDEVIDKLYVKRLIRYLPQQRFLPINLKVIKAIDLLIEKPNDQISIKAINDVANILNKRIGELSGGQVRFLEIILVLYSNVNFILLDEPFSHISPLQVEFISLLIKKQTKNKGIIVTDHIYDYVLRISTQKYYLQEGRIINFNDKEDLLQLGYINNL